MNRAIVFFKRETNDGHHPHFAFVNKEEFYSVTEEIIKSPDFDVEDTGSAIVIWNVECRPKEEYTSISSVRPRRVLEFEDWTLVWSQALYEAKEDEDMGDRKYIWRYNIILPNEVAEKTLALLGQHKNPLVDIRTFVKPSGETHSNVILRFKWYYKDWKLGFKYREYVRDLVQMAEDGDLFGNNTGNYELLPE